MTKSRGRVLKRVLIAIAGTVLAVWLGFALMIALYAGPSNFFWGFAAGLVGAPSVAADWASAVLFPKGATRFAVLQCSCNSWRFDLPEAQWSAMEARTRGERAYFGWIREAPSEVTAYAIVQSSNGPVTSKIVAEEWNAATPVRAQQVNPDAKGKGRYFSVQGKRFRTCSSGASTAAVTPDGTKLAISTWEGPKRPSGLYFFDPSRSKWVYHLEVWRIDSGEKLLEEESIHMCRGCSPQPVRLIWATSRLLLVSGRPDRFSVEACPFSEPHEIREYPNGQIGLEALTADAAADAKVTVRPIDGDRNGRFDALELTADFGVRKPGEYSFSAAVSRGGEFVTSGHISRPLAAGPQRLKVLFEAEDFQDARGKGPFMMENLEVRGPDGVARSYDRILLSELGISEATPFRLTGENSHESEWRGTPPRLVEVKGEIGYVSPGGVCRWVGEIAQGNKRYPISGQENTQPGGNRIPWRLPSEALVGVSREQLGEVRLLSLDCGGRSLRPRNGAPYLVAYPASPGAENDLPPSQ